MSMSFLTSDQIEKCELLLNDAVEKTESMFAILSNSTGLIVAKSLGKATNSYIKLEDFSILAAANLSAISEMANSIDQPKGFNTMFMEGDEVSHYMVSINKHFILQLLFSSDVRVGKVRYYATELKKSIMDIISTEEQNESLLDVFDDDYFVLLDEQIEKTLSLMDDKDFK